MENEEIQFDERELNIPPLRPADRQRVRNVVNGLIERINNSATHPQACERRWLQVLHDNKLSDGPDGVDVNGLLVSQAVNRFAYAGRPLAEVIAGAACMALTVGYELGEAGVDMPPLPQPDDDEGESEHRRRTH